MINGTIKMEFTDKGGSAEVNLKCTNGLVDKCFIIETICNALKMDEKEKSTALMIVAMAGDVPGEEDSNDES